MMQQQNITPLQRASQQAAKERAWRKIEAARRFAEARRAPDPVPVITMVRQEPVKKVEAPKPLIPPSFKTTFSRRIIWEGEYCPYAGGSTELVQTMDMLDIAKAWLSKFPGISMSQVRGNRRSRHIIFPRHVIIHAIRTQRPDLSLPQIGRFMGGRDHSTIVSAVKKINKMISQGKLEAGIRQWREVAASQPEGRK